MWLLSIKCLKRVPDHAIFAPTMAMTLVLSYALLLVLMPHFPFSCNSVGISGVIAVVSIPCNRTADMGSRSVDESQLIN